MGQQKSKFIKRQRTKKQIEEIQKNPQNYIVIHYSCESFYDIKDGRTPRITSIVARNFDSGQTDSFSIHKVAEQKQIDVSDIDGKYDSLEKEMLDEFYEFVRTRRHCSWIHWNMRDINYGFQAIEHRYRVLNGEPIEISEERKFDLSRALINLYSVKYIGHPRLQKIMDFNRITAKDFLSGEEEADAFDNKEYVKLHQSTLRKADVLANLLNREIDGTLKTNSTWKDKIGFYPGAIVTFITEHWIWALVVIIVTLGSLYSLTFN